MKALISLESDAEIAFLQLNRNVRGPLRRFGVNGKSLTAWQYFVYGVSGRRWPLSPGEVGCSLSHLTALQAFLASEDDFLTVYEADVFVRDELVDPRVVFDQFPGQPVVLHLGGQEGLLKRPRLFGQVIHEVAGVRVWHLARYSTRWLFRTCGYMVNREAASLIAKAYQRRLQRADDWGQLLYGRRCVFLFMPMVTHPLQLNNSLLENERRQLSPPSLPRRCATWARSGITLALLRVSGNRRIP